ncbi:MAG: UDP-N-acetylmuramate--L-alanine ligase [Pseudomonadota bacterium]
MSAHDYSESGGMHRMRKLHFIGIGGVGMGGIAEVLINLGYHVSGSDQAANALTSRLQSLGAKVSIGHDATHVSDVDVVVISSAIADDNPELMAAREQRVPIIPRAEMLAELMRFRRGIAVAGTHGKTTTTSLVASVLAEGGLDPTYVIGGRLNSSASNAKLGRSPWLVAEADESDASFLYLQPVISIVTNVDADHLSTYDGDFERLRHTFVEFLHHLPFYGLAIICIDDEHAQGLLQDLTRPALTYGLDPEADIRAEKISQRGMQTHFDVLLPDGQRMVDVALNMPGQHNVLNALAAIAVGYELGVKGYVMAHALRNFEGVGRRVQMCGSLYFDGGEATLIDDYGHHPREIEATIAAIRASHPERRLVVAFQPHRYSRTRDLFEDFAAVLAEPDVLVLSEVYAAGEPPIASADGRALSRAVRNRGVVDPIFIEDVNQLSDTLTSILQDGDVVLTLGAGNIGAVASDLPQAMSKGTAHG